MNDLTPIPCVMMRGGTSKGPFFLASDLPADIAERDQVLIEAMGSGQELEIDGIGGGNPQTSKVAIISKSKRPGADVDYLFAQVKVLERSVDTSPNCGNMLAAVGPFAIETGLIAAKSGQTLVRIFNVNTGKLMEASIQTPGGRVSYKGDAKIDGVPGSAAPVQLAFFDAAGAKTGKLLPTGNARDRIDGIDVSLVDCAMPVMLVAASDLGKTGYEKPTDLDADKEFMARMEDLRIKAGKKMGFANVAEMVIPKPVLLSPATRGGALSTRYFMPHVCHKALATTGAVAIATACVTPGTIAADFAGKVTMPATLSLEHASGQLDVVMEQRPGQAQPVASILRTARRLFEGQVLVSRPRVG